MKFKEYMKEENVLNESKNIVSDPIFTIDFQKKLGKKEYDPQTKKLMIEVVRDIQSKLKVSQNISDAIMRLNTVASMSGATEQENRNQIFKAAASLGLKLPSGSF